MTRLAFAGLLALGVALSHAASAQETPSTAAPVHAIHKAKKAPRPKHQAAERPATAPSGINAPSMNFSGVSPDMGDPSDDPNAGRAGPRPSINSDGTPGMAFGF